jgi:peptidoglycan/xylan/chitin deacetylase (PgdA/CDA1 family)
MGAVVGSVCACSMNSSSKLAVGIGACAAVGVGLTFYQPWPLLRAVAHLTPEITWFGPGERREVALTFDDGPDPRYTPAILRSLADAGIRGTFFLIGSNAERYPELVEHIRAGGHQIANHMWRDENALLLSTAGAEESLLRTECVLAKFGMTKWMRPAGGFGRTGFLRRARARGYRVVIASAYASDPRRPPAAYIRWAISRMLRPGSIVVLHDSGGDRSRSVAALPGILQAAHHRNLRWVTLDDMFAT